MRFPGARNRRDDRLVGRLWVLVVGTACADFVYGAVFVQHLQAGGLTPTTIGMVLLLPLVASLLVEVPSGAWGDRYGHRRLAVVGLLAWGAGLVLFGAADGPALVAAALALWSVGLMVWSGTAVALVVTVLRASGREGDVPRAVRGAEVARWLAACAAALIVLLAVDRVGTGALVAVAGGLLCVLAVWVALDWPDTPVRSTDPIGRTVVAGVRVLTGVEGRGLVLATLGTGTVLGALVLTWQPFVVDVMAGPTSWLGAGLLVLSVCAALGAWASRWTARRAPGRVLACTVPAAAASLLLVGLPHPWWGFAGYLLAEVFLGWSFATAAVWAQAVLTDGLRATGMSLLGAASGVAMAATQGVVGVVWDGVGLERAVVLTASTVLLAGLLAVLGSLLAPALRAGRPRR